jgi:hypothetical protein
MKCCPTILFKGNAGLFKGNAGLFKGNAGQFKGNARKTGGLERPGRNWFQARGASRGRDVNDH